MTILRSNRFFLLCVAGMLSVMVGCGDYSSGHLEVKRTSENTWRIYDPDSDPELYVDRTCETEGKVVVQLQTPGEAYEYINVVCADPQASPTPVPTVDPYE